MARIAFSERPGRHERHFIRKVDNGLFPRPIRDFTDEDLLEVQRADHEELLNFLQSLRELVGRAIALKPNEETQVILDLKSVLEKHYEQACGLADNQSANKQAIAQLIDVIMATIQSNAAGDTLAEQELAEEALARKTHFSLLESPLVADLLHPHSVIEADELAAVLLTDPEEIVRPALVLFDVDQRRQVAKDMQFLLENKGVDDTSLFARMTWLQSVE
ncbi:MAG TPA: hypothetical protein EYP34_00390 [Chromatiaceae bacterium]|nr:hypothetical protein [Chromatiaceae bacterium]